MTNDLLALADWLRGEGCGPVVMEWSLESTGSYWRPVFNLLEAQCEVVVVVVVNAYHVKAVPGRETEVKDAEWLADLLRHGLLRASFIPPAPQRHLRDLTRYRIQLVDERARLTNRQPSRARRRHQQARFRRHRRARALERVKCCSDCSTARRRDGETDAQALAELARPEAEGQAGSARPGGRWAPRGPPHLPGTREQLAHLEYLDTAIARVDAELEAR
jgi:transposase